MGGAKLCEVRARYEPTDKTAAIAIWMHVRYITNTSIKHSDWNMRHRLWAWLGGGGGSGSHDIVDISWGLDTLSTSLLSLQCSSLRVEIVGEKTKTLPGIAE